MKYKLGAKVYIVSLCGIALNGGFLLFENDIILRLFLISVIVVAIVNMFAMSISYYKLTGRKLIMKGMFKSISINLDEIEQISSQPAGKFVKESIVVYSRDKRIIITALTKGYLELILKIVNELPRKDRVKIENYVERKIQVIKNAN